MAAKTIFVFRWPTEHRKRSVWKFHPFQVSDDDFVISALLQLNQKVKIMQIPAENYKQTLCDFQCIVFAFAHMYLAFLPTHQAETSFLCIIVFNSANWLTAYMGYTVIIPSRRCINPQQNKCESLFLVILCNTCCHSVCVSEAATICNEFLDAALHISLQRDVQVRNSWISTKSHKASLAMSPRAWGVEPSALLGASISRNAD